MLLVFSAMVFTLSAQTLKTLPAIPEQATYNTRAEGLLATHWTQSEPYNVMCPRDPSSNNRSFAGCPAVAMGQILNHIRSTNHTRFTDLDDYEHDYQGRHYFIDDDHSTLDFPSFPELNGYLETIDSLFALGHGVKDDLAAALIFACGTACTQVYTCAGSGTFNVYQAYNGYLRFGFTNSLLFTEPTVEMYNLLNDNLQHGYPAHLAIESPDGMMGHNVVVDGYRPEDSTYHMNFGYGGSEDGWYKIPDPNFPYGLSQLEGIILNIIPEPLAIDERNHTLAIKVYPNPGHETLTIEASGLQQFSIVNMLGQTVMEVNAISDRWSGSIEHLQAGTYHVRATTCNGTTTSTIIIQ